MFVCNLCQTRAYQTKYISNRNSLSDFPQLIKKAGPNHPSSGPNHPLISIVRVRFGGLIGPPRTGYLSKSNLYQGLYRIDFCIESNENLYQFKFKVKFQRRIKHLFLVRILHCPSYFSLTITVMMLGTCAYSLGAVLREHSI